VLRRQLHRDIRKPLVIFTPKSLLRARVARSPIGALETGSFEEVLDDAGVDDPGAVRRVVLCSGKVAYDVMRARDAADAPVAVVRVEQLFPWPADTLSSVVGRYPGVTSVVWVQEEPENMGAWPFAGGRLQSLFADRYSVSASMRRESGSPAAGSLTVHQQEQEELVARALDFAG
jgi:2-oxoglutarate dehydrogenase complex dehydrogenase (E1) component-like enzyme